MKGKNCSLHQHQRLSITQKFALIASLTHSCLYFLGELPYRGVKGVVELQEMLQDGVRLEKPAHCSEEL